METCSLPLWPTPREAPPRNPGFPGQTPEKGPWIPKTLRSLPAMMSRQTHHPNSKIPYLSSRQ